MRTASLSSWNRATSQVPILRIKCDRLPALVEPCRFNGFNPTTTLVTEDLASWLNTEWYCAHRGNGGEWDYIAEQILREVAAADASGISAQQQGELTLSEAFAGKCGYTDRHYLAAPKSSGHEQDAEPVPHPDPIILRADA